MNNLIVIEKTAIRQDAVGRYFLSCFELKWPHEK